MQHYVLLHNNTFYSLWWGGEALVVHNKLAATMAHRGHMHTVSHHTHFGGAGKRSWYTIICAPASASLSARGGQGRQSLAK